MNGTDLLVDDSVPGFYEAAVVDTYQIVRYSFEGSNAMGWTTVDHTAQHDIFYHVDDFAGLAGGNYGLLTPISGSQSMWCGARPGDDNYLCSWKAAPGYGNNWNQHFESDEIAGITTYVQLDYHAVTHCEGIGYDEAYVDYLDNSDEWVTLRTFGGHVDTIDMIGLTVAESGTSTRFRFRFTSDDAWSDQDGLLDTDGAVTLDDIEVTADSVVLDTEDFESATVGDHSTTFWTGFGEPPYGVHSEMMTGLVEPDPCHDDNGTQWAFLEGSVEQANQILYPGMYITPRCLNGNGKETPCQNEEIISPMIDMTKYSTANDNVQDADIPVGDQSLFGEVFFRFQVFRDLPLDNLVFYTWGVRNITNGCPGNWKDRGFVYYGPDRDCLFTGQRISNLLTSPNDTLQLNLGVSDMCDTWGGIAGTCTSHTPSPWFDSVYVQRVKASGPQWSYRKLDLFQDNFPPAEDQNGFIRADAANDIAAIDNLNQIIPGDSIVVTVASPIAGGIKEANNLPAVYMHVKVTPADYAFADLPGDVTNGDCNYVSNDGTWAVIQGDTAQFGNPASVVLDRYAFDLNDALFTYGHVIEYYFSATDQNAETGYLPTNALDGGCFEWTCLPSDPAVKHILYVDDFDGIGSWDGLVQNYMEPALTAFYPVTWDRYDINSPLSMAGNGLESRINATNLGLFYDTIIWDSGNLNTGTIGNKTPTSGKCNDVALLQSWAEDQTDHEHKTNMLIMGDGIVENLYNTGSVSFLNNVLRVNLADQSYLDMTGGIGGGGSIAPLVTPVPGSVFDGLENFYVFGGCPIINHFDVLDTTSSIAEYGLKYPDYDGSFRYAAIYSDDMTTNNWSKRIVTTGFSFMYIRDADDQWAPARNEFLNMVFEFFENGSPWTGIEEPDTIPESPTPAITPYKLCQNYPNPFNPWTTIKYTMKKKGHVSIRIYDISGRLVRSLIDDIKSEGPNRKVW